MGIHNIIEQQLQQEATVAHQFHIGPFGFNELCNLCVNQLQEAQREHIALEVMEQEQMDEEDNYND